MYYTMLIKIFNQYSLDDNKKSTMRGKTFEIEDYFPFIVYKCTSFRLMLSNSCQIVSEIHANTGLEPVTRSGVLITWCCTLIMMEQ